MKTIYKTKASKSATLELYDNQLTKLGYDYKDIFVNTSFGKTHLVETGNLNGHPGKSAEVSLSPNGYEYGKWANEVIDELGFDKISCFGGSYGGGVLAKLMCVAPEKIAKSVLVVPSGINNAFPIASAKMMVPLLKYICTKDDKFIIETALFMAITKDVLDKDTLDTVKNSFDHVKTKTGMPSNIDAKQIQKCTAPTLVMAGEKDCLFPAKRS